MWLTYLLVGTGVGLALGVTERFVCKRLSLNLIRLVVILVAGSTLWLASTVLNLGPSYYWFLTMLGCGLAWRLMGVEGLYRT